MDRATVLRTLAAAILIASGALACISPGFAAEGAALAEVLDLDEAAAMLRVKPDLVRVLAETQRIPARSVGDTWRFSRIALLEWLKGERFAGMAIVPSSHPDTSIPASVAARITGADGARSGLVDPPTRAAQAVPAANPDPNARPSTVGERPAARTAEEIALRDQRVLLRRGDATVDVGVSYSHSEQTLVPVLRVEQSTAAATGTLRYGLRDDLQITSRLPSVWRRTTTYTDGTVGPTAAAAATSEHYAGDASLSLLGVAMRESKGRPNIIWSLDSVLPTGPGDKGIGGGIVLAKSYDPVVLIAGLSYLYGLSTDPANPRRSLAKNNVGLTFGYTYALNDTLALSGLFTGTYRTSISQNGIAIPPSREQYQLQFGMTWMLARGFYLEPAVAMRLGGASPDVTFSLNVPYSFK